ncbi:MAG: binding-protein-dependent transport system inner rane component [Hyphomicrobiales bacterium]|nr:binding-protein-dependent transport system inner rane component [Hyphomicrobiales bacterium]
MPEELSPRTVIAARMGVILLWLATWEAFGRQQPELLSYPSLVVTYLWSMISSFELFSLLAASARIFLSGWVLAVLIGVTIGVVVGASRPVRLMFEPFLNALYSTPLVALIPLMVLWFGLGEKAMIISVVLNAVFPMIIMTIIGSRNAGKEYREVARSFRLGRIQTILKVVLPGALPYLLVGLRLTTSSALRGTIFAGFLIPDQGIGNALRSAGDALNASRLYGLIMVVVICALLVDVVLRRGIKLIDYTR